MKKLATTFMVLEFVFLAAVFIVLGANLSTGDYFIAVGLYVASVIFEGGGNNWTIEVKVSDKSYDLSWIATVVGLGFFFAFLVFILRHVPIETYRKAAILYMVSCAFSILKTMRS